MHGCFKVAVAAASTGLNTGLRLRGDGRLQQSNEWAETHMHGSMSRAFIPRTTEGGIAVERRKKEKAICRECERSDITSRTKKKKREPEKQTLDFFHNQHVERTEASSPFFRTATKIPPLHESSRMQFIV